MEPSERAGDLGALIKGWLAKDAVSAKGQQTNRYFALVPSCLLYFDSDSSSAFKPKGAWALSECNGNGRLLKRAGLRQNQAVLLRGHRELVLTAESVEDLRRWNKAVSAATNASPARVAVLEAQIAQLNRDYEAQLVQLTLTRSALNEEREQRAAALRHNRRSSSNSRSATTTHRAAVDRSGRIEEEEKEEDEDEDEEVRQSGSDGEDGSARVPSARQERELRALKELEQAHQEMQRWRAPSVANARMSTSAVAAAALSPAPGGGGGGGEGGDNGGGGGCSSARVPSGGAAPIAASASSRASSASALRAELIRQVQSRREEDLLAEAARAATLELQDLKEDLVLQSRRLEEEAVTASQRASRLRSQSTDDREASAAREAEEQAAVASEAAASVAWALEQQGEHARRTPLRDEMERCADALKALGARLRDIDDPEASLLYAALLTTRAKLSRAVEAQGAWAL